MTTIMKKITKGIVLNGESSDLSDNLEGSLFHNKSTARIKSYIQGAVREVLTNSQSQVLTNKTIAAVDNTIVVASSNPNLSSTGLNAALSELQDDLDRITNVSWTGNYNNGRTYTVGEGVMFNGASFRMINFIGAAGYPPSSYPANWLQVTDYVPAISSAAQTALDGKANSVHTHVAADITDFNSAVDARIPDVVLDSDDVEEGTTNLYFTNERVDDRVKDLLVAGSGVSLTYDDIANTLTVAATSAGVEDATTLVKGKIQLAGDLAGTADLPTVPSLSFKAPLESPALTGTPTAPTATTGNNSTQIATTAFVTTAVAAGGGGGGGSSDYIIDEMISKTSTGTSALGLIYKRVRSATSLTSFSSLMVNEGTPTSGNLTFDIKVGEVPYALTSRFGSGSIINSMEVQTDGKVILVGAFTIYDGKSVGRNIIRLNTNGSVDTSFSVGTGFDSGSDIKVVKILSDGSVLVGGSFVSYNGATLSGLCKLSSVGALNTAFTSSGTRKFNTLGGGINDIQVRSSGKILLLGDYTTSGYPVVAKGLMQLNADGSYDSSFEAGNSNTVSTKFTQGLLMSDGSLFAVGIFTSYTLLSGTSYTVFGIVKLTSAGLKDATFTTSGTSQIVNTIDLHQGNIILGGDFGISSFGGISTAKIAKLNSTTGAVIGSPTFIPPSTTQIQRIKVASDGTIFVSKTSSDVYKLNSDGTSNITFTGAISSVNCFAFASNGNLLVGGAFTTVNSTAWLGNGRISPITGASDITYDTLVSIFDALPSFNFASLVNGDVLNGTIARPSILAGSYIKVDVTVVPSTYTGSFYITLY